MNVPVFLIESICFLASLSLLFQRLLPYYLRLFTVFMLITLIVEWIGAAFRDKYPSEITNLYSFFNAFEFEFYLFIIRMVIISKKIKNVLLYVLSFYPFMVFINLFLVNDGDFHTMAYSFGCLLIVSSTIYYFYEIFQLPKSVNLVREPAFWICTALLFYYCCTLMIFGLWNVIRQLSTVIYYNIRGIMSILNILLYSLFSIAFLCRLGVQKSIKV